MEQDFCLDRLREAGLAPVVPSASERAEVHQIIFDELCKGIVRDESRATFERIAARLIDEEGADGVILGCTEVG